MLELPSCTVSDFTVEGMRQNSEVGVVRRPAAGIFCCVEGGFGCLVCGLTQEAGSCDCLYPGKNTGVGCYFLLQCMKVKSESEVTQSCPTLSDPMDCSLPGSSVHGIFQARALE